MMRWQDRPLEERHLLNPAFCSNILWHAAKGASHYNSSSARSLSFAEAFLVLPIVLHQKTRTSLPNTIRTSLPLWIGAQPLLISTFPMRCKALAPYTKEAITFGASSQFFSIDGNALTDNGSFSRSVSNSLRGSSEEVRACMKKAEFLGKWFSHSGEPTTIFTLFGIRP